MALGPCGACGKAVRLSAVLYTADARLVCPICFTREDVFAARRRPAFDGGPVALIGALAAVAPLVARAAAGLMVAADAASRRDWCALAGGIAALVCGGATMLAARAQASAAWFALGVAIAAFGVYHLAGIAAG